MDQVSIERIVIDALQELYAKEAEILHLDVGEPTICGRLADILRRKFDHHSVHVEYNLHGIEPKEVEMPDANGKLSRRRVRPDIVIHQPGHDEQNLLVIEVKKSTNRMSDDADLTKLAQIKQQMNYRSAVFLRLATGSTADERNNRIVWV